MLRIIHKEGNIVQLCFPSIEGMPLHGHFDGGTLSPPLLLRGIDRQIGLTERLTNTFGDRHHPGHIIHSIRAMFAHILCP
ncbi:MAG: hypothetical protein PHE55_06955 [Methylococcaceae bacterium]|nr:hypothetical protein [Methylococcaceae bacterium]